MGFIFKIGMLERVLLFIFELQEKLSENQTIFEVPVELKLRLEPAQFSFSESVVGKDGTIFVTSFEDDEDVTVEVIEDA